VKPGARRGVVDRVQQGEQFARPVAVASGSYTLAELSAHDPWLALEELPSPSRFREMLMLDG